MLIHADHASLEDRKVALNGVGRHVAAGVLLIRVLHRLVLGKALADVRLVLGFIGVKAGLRRSVRFDERADLRRG